MPQHALTAYPRTHRYAAFVIWAAVVGVVGWFIRAAPIPVVAGSPGVETAQAIAFYLSPLMLLPVLCRLLDGASRQLEEQAARPLVGPRLLDCLFTWLVGLACLTPAAIPLPQDAFWALVQNTTALFALALVLHRWLAAELSWIPMYLLGLAGVMGPQTGAWARVAVITRTAEGTRLTVVVALLVVAIAFHAARRPSPHRWRVD